MNKEGLKPKGFFIITYNKYIILILRYQVSISITFFGQIKEIFFSQNQIKEIKHGRFATMAQGPEIGPVPQ